MGRQDPTANAAARNVEGQQRAAVIHFHEDGQPARLWMDIATFRSLARLVVTLTDDNGERHVRFNEKAAALLEQNDGYVTKKGNNS